MRICFIGDSFVNGTGDPECLGWTGRICAAARKQGYDITYYNLGVRRETSADIRSRWLGEVACRLPKEYDGRIVFSFGVNDTTLENGKTRVKLADSLENYCAILEVARQIFPVLMVGSPPVAEIEQNFRIAGLSEQLARLCSDRNVPYLDVFTPLQASSVWIGEATANDGAHPGAAGYAEFAHLVQSWSAWLSWLK
ncbi:GDSL-type esterase/lipase family protein [Coleofasciculus sp. FACHB-SPT36]|uniref:GDSL-type esterase/lipase family protein n=1 Tax=Cyanophyceae TaxID=3028117 RepID=UPI00168A53B3|nr:GDSL-type esterase/lipase family protein [Coleofasciculus sp. FACHB-SPT36]MBD2541303.1 lipase [Coleofasciculus sp. FACHB-SPT36]